MFIMRTLSTELALSVRVYGSVKENVSQCRRVWRSVGERGKV